jgi:hypothetical protein
MVGTSVAIEFGHFDRTRRGEGFDGGGLFSVSATHAEAPSERFAFKISAGLLAQEALLRPVGNVPGSSTPYPSFQNRGTTQPRLDARADYDFADHRSRIIVAGGITGTEGIIHSGLGPLDIQGGSTFKYGRVTYYRDRLKLQAFVNALDAEGPMLLLRGLDGRLLEPTFENQTYDVEFRMPTIWAHDISCRMGATSGAITSISPSRRWAAPAGKAGPTLRIGSS